MLVHNWHRPSVGTGTDFSSCAGTGKLKSPYWHRATTERPALELGKKMRFCCAHCWNWMSSAGTGHPVLELDNNLVTPNWHQPHTGTGANVGCPILALGMPSSSQGCACHTTSWHHTLRPKILTIVEKCDPSYLLPQQDIAPPLLLLPCVSLSKVTLPKNGDKPLCFYAFTFFHSPFFN